MTRKDNRMTVKEMIDELSTDDLYKLQFDLKSGGRHLKHLVDERIKAIESRPRKICATCGTPLSDDESIYTLTFGPPDFRKQANFCGQDCLEYFLERMKPLKTVQREESGINPAPKPQHHPVRRRKQNPSLFKKLFRWSGK
ncbi:hypothetical protein D6764_00615 [Candidatus Woesearchaeota archaeon]|nr:MAG: hypothetical protein D6764_00615 [Candidatus Woesearchaeota archaeon]